MKQLLTALLLIFSMAQVSYAEKVFYCTEELSTGIHLNTGDGGDNYKLSGDDIYREGTWETASFKKDRFTIKFSDDYTKVEGPGKDMVLSDDIGAKDGILTVTIVHSCHYMSRFRGLDVEYDKITCIDDQLFTGSTFLFHKKNHRFVWARPGPAGFVNGLTYGMPDSDYLSAGTCETF